MFSTLYSLSTSCCYRQESNKTTDVKCDWEPEEAAHTEEMKEEQPEEAPAEKMDLSELTPEALGKMTVAKLRIVARELGTTGMSRRDIRFAKKEDLIERITKALGQEG